MFGVQSQLQEWGRVVLAFFESLFIKLGDYVPNLFGAIFILIIGVITARILRGITRRVLKVLGFTALGERAKFNKLLKKAGIEKRLDDIMAAIVYYMILLVFIVSASEILGITVVLDTLNKFIFYLPHVFGVFVILIVTLVVAESIKNAAASVLSNLNIGYASPVASSLKIIIIGFGILIALSELGFDMTVFIAHIAILIGGAVLAVVLSIGLGSRSIMSNMLARYYIKQLFKIGDDVLLIGQKGKVVKITPVSVVLSTEKGDEVHIPNERIIKEGSGFLSQSLHAEKGGEKE